MKHERANHSTLRRLRWPIAAAVWALCQGVSLAEQAAQPLQPDAYFRADRAYRAIEANKLDDAEAATRAALAVQSDSLQLNLLLLDVLTRKGQLNAARAQADALLQKYPNEPRVYAQHGFLAQRAGDPAVAEQDFAHAVQGTDWTPQEQRNLHMAWSDSAYSAKHPQAALDALNDLRDQPSADVQLRLAQSRLQLGDRDGATQAATLAVDHATDPAQQRYAKALLAQAMAPEPQGEATSADDPRTIGQRELNEAYSHLRARDDRAALAAFQRGFANGQGNWSHYADAAYAAKRLGDNPTAIKLFRQSLDHADADAKGDSGADVDNSGAARLPADRRFGYRREVEQMQRTWGMVLSGAYQTSAFGLPNTVSVLQGGAEVYWQPPGIGYRDGSIFQVFVRGYDNLLDRNGVAGLPTAQGSVGARYKPIKDMNLVFTAERLMRIGRLSTNDTLLRIGFSTDQGIDLQVTKPRWQTWQVYGEAAYFLNQGRMIISTEARYGHTWLLSSISDHLTVYPHIVLAGDHDNKATDRQLALGVGPGINFRYWFRETSYSAPASWLDLTVQYRLPLTHADRAKGVVARAILWF